MRIEILTLFPEMCESVLSESIIGRARKQGKVQIHCRNIRDYTQDKHKRVDDAPYGGGFGMVMQCGPIADCYRAVCADWGVTPKLFYMSPQGKVLTQAKAKELSESESFVLLCGHYEGVDERVLEALEAEEISIGDYVLTGGELPALVLCDAVVRLLPGVLAGPGAYEGESHYPQDNTPPLLEHAQYTRPPVWEGREVPAILIGGNHALQEKWRKEDSLRRTQTKRPDLLQ
ncbi:MAG: tRNA (guanosine(37)-N1)-methyltransferase TrmD [Oscillospiraceae bacterium]|jgi:tRNA (guanine37-N1)-methyltransferase|nr:tRNA (guanosine(37)-N1)-methyltransferase TrmD [Oscillospiraceae bacterium]